MIDKTDIFRRLGGILEELNEQYTYLSKTTGNLNELELELFLANSNFLNDHIHILQKLNQNKFDKAIDTNFEINNNLPDGDIKPPIETLIPEIEIPLAANQNLFHPEEVLHDYIETEQEDEDEEVNEGEQASELETYKYKDEAESELKEVQTFVEPEQPFEQIEPVDDILAPRPEENMERHNEEKLEQDLAEMPPSESVELIEEPSAKVPPTLNDVISAQRSGASLGSNLNRQSSTDLKSLISLNNKLLFVKDLFNGYSLAYSEAIELTNRLDNMESAENFLKANYSAKNNWDAKPTTVEKFYEILQTRFQKA